MLKNNHHSISRLPSPNARWFLTLIPMLPKQTNKIAHNISLRVVKWRDARRWVAALPVSSTLSLHWKSRNVMTTAVEPLTLIRTCVSKTTFNCSFNHKKWMAMSLSVIFLLSSSRRMLPMPHHNHLSISRQWSEILWKKGWASAHGGRTCLEAS